MRVLVACEFSGIVTAAFRDRGHDAYSCDLLETEGNPEYHYKGDIHELLNSDSAFDLMIAHPPCTYLTIAGNRWFHDKPELIQSAVNFVRSLFVSDIPRICIENPIGRLSTYWRKPDQYVQPWQFGHGEVKKTGFWLKNLPLLQPTEIVEGRHPRSWLESPGPDRWKRRSRTYQGIANAMADQWGCLPLFTPT